jgi:hypothetical protein
MAVVVAVLVVIQVLEVLVVVQVVQELLAQAEQVEVAVDLAHHQAVVVAVVLEYWD